MRTLLEAAAMRELTGVGDPALGQWVEWSGSALHVKRRLTPAEVTISGGMEDIRRTLDAQRRAASLGARIRYAPASVLADEIGDPS